MIMMGDQRKRAASIVSGHAGEHSQNESPSESVDKEPEANLHPVSEALIDAVHSKDPKAVTSALRAFLLHHENLENK